MRIRKLFKYEMSHKVFNAYTRRCRENVHGHSYKLELCFTGNNPDKADMLVDFTIIKEYYSPFVDSFDHSHVLWTADNNAESNIFLKKYNERWIELPFNSSAEMQAKMFFIYSDMMLSYLKSKKIVHWDIQTSSAIVHETDTGYAEYRSTDVGHCNFPEIELSDIIFSDHIKSEWPDYLNHFLKGE